MPPIVTVSCLVSPGISWIKYSPVMVISVPPASLPLGGKMLAIVDGGLYVKVASSDFSDDHPSGFVTIT